MGGELIDGKRIAGEILNEVGARVASETRRRRRPPSLSVVLVGDDPASAVYVRNKQAACERLGIVSSTIHMPAASTREEILACVERLNRDAGVDGILVQWPLPGGVDPFAVAAVVDPCKDVDGFHPVNLGRLLAGTGGGFVPCTPLGIKVLLGRSGVDVSGRHVAIVGRSNIVGKPLAALLMQKAGGANATVTVCHSMTRDLGRIVRAADVVVAAVGSPRFIGASMIREGAVVVDVGINRIRDASARGGTRLVGDVDFDAVRPIASRITPVPGGVGPMTIAMLMSNTADAYERRNGVGGA